MRSRRSSPFHLLLILGGITMLLPLAFMITTALAEPGQALRTGGSLRD